MKTLIRAIAAALASIPRYIKVWCARARDFLLECLPAAPNSGGLTTAAGLEAEDAVDEIRQAREERKLFKESCADIVLRWAAAVVSGGAPPDVSKADPILVEWLADLEVSACRRILRCEHKGLIERHLKPRYDSDHLEGVPSLGGCRPYSAPPVGYGSKAENAAAVVFVEELWDGILNGVEEDEYA